MRSAVDQHGPPSSPETDRRPALPMPIPIFDLDGTLLDSDAALLDAFVALGVDRELVTYGHVVADECARLGLTVDAYLDTYDVTAAAPYPGVAQLVEKLDLGPGSVGVEIRRERPAEMANVHHLYPVAAAATDKTGR